MPLPKQDRIRINDGASFGRAWLWCGADLTGASVVFEVRDAPGGTLRLRLTSDDGDIVVTQVAATDDLAAHARIAAAATPEQTAEAVDGLALPRTAVFAVRVTHATDAVTDLVEGTAVLKPRTAQ
jgi:hypothetical protein